MRIFKYISMAGAFFVITAIGFFIYSVSKLPDPRVIKNKLQAEQPKSDSQHQKAETQAVSKNIKNEPKDLPESKDAGALVESETKNPTGAIFDLINEDYQDIRVCSNLGNISNTKLDSEILQKAMFEKRQGDPVVESFRIPMKHIFQSKPVKELFSEIESVDTENLSGEEKTNYFEKIGFYTFAANKAREIYNQKSEYEEIADRAEHLHVIAKIVRHRPDLANDKSVLDFCNQVEGAIALKNKTDIAEERKEILKLIEYAGLTPKELSFNPNVRTKFNLELNKKGISFGFTHPGVDIQ